MKHFNVQVSGKVQGVFFRAATKAVADRLGINGFVQNEPNGEVYIEAEGVEEKLKLFLEWCAHGPERAQVANIQMQESGLKNYNVFEIRR